MAGVDIGSENYSGFIPLKDNDAIKLNNEHMVMTEAHSATVPLSPLASSFSLLFTPFHKTDFVLSCFDGVVDENGRFGNKCKFPAATRSTNVKFLRAPEGYYEESFTGDISYHPEAGEIIDLNSGFSGSLTKEMLGWDGIGTIQLVMYIVAGGGDGGYLEASSTSSGYQYKYATGGGAGGGVELVTAPLTEADLGEITIERIGVNEDDTRVYFGEALLTCTKGNRGNTGYTSSVRGGTAGNVQVTQSSLIQAYQISQGNGGDQLLASPDYRSEESLYYEGKPWSASANGQYGTFRSFAGGSSILAQGASARSIPNGSNQIEYAGYSGQHGSGGGGCAVSHSSGLHDDCRGKGGKGLIRIFVRRIADA